MSPQTETKTGAGFKAGVKDYRLFLIRLNSFTSLFLNGFLNFILEVLLLFFSLFLICNVLMI